MGVRKDSLCKHLIEKSFSNKWFPFHAYQKYKDAVKKYNWGKPTPFGVKSLQKPENVPFELCVESCLVPKQQLNDIPNANEFFNLYKPLKELNEIYEGETNRPSFKRLHRYKYSPTVCYGNNEVHLHPYYNRRLSVREALRIQGVSDEYKLPSNIPLTKKFKMIGNGVPVPLAMAVAKAMMQLINQYQITITKQKKIEKIKI